jgi:cyclase
MLAKRVIVCLDVANGRVVKGVNFLNLKDAGDPSELAARYYEMGADEVTFLDISASVEERSTTIELVKKTADTVFIPLTVGGGISSVVHVDRLLRAGADKISVNTSAIKNPNLLNEISDRFGNQVLVLSVDARRVSNPDEVGYQFEVTTHGGKQSANLDALAWIKEGEERGVGEILLNSMDADGTTQGFDIEMIRQARSVCSVPIIASGGAGKVEDFTAALDAGADAVLAASVFHFNTLTINQVKSELMKNGYAIRME